MLTPLMPPWKANPLGFSWNEPAGIVTEKVPICRVTFSVTGLIPLLFAPNVKDSFRSKPCCAISSLAEDEANGVAQLTLLGLKVICTVFIVFPPTIRLAEPEKLNGAPFRGPNGFVSAVLKVPLEG